MRAANEAALDRALEQLTALDREVLIERWTEAFGAAPPPHTSRPLLVRAVAYKMQERALGGLSPATRHLLSGETERHPRPARVLQPGTVLLREWQGITHQVTIGEGAVLYRGQRYRSLSEVARLITGSRWSGPRFFGLKT